MNKLDVAYVRCSSENQSIEMQREILEEFTAGKSDKLKWIEEIWSGRKMDAPGLARLRALVESGIVDRIFVYSYNRLGRNTRKGCEFVEECLKNGTEVISFLERQDLRTPDGYAAFQRMLVDSELFLKHLSINTQLGLRNAKKKGRFVGGSPVGSRWMAAKTKAKLPKIIKLLDKGLTHREVAKLLEVDERTVRNVANNRDDLPKTRPSVWKK